MFSCHTWLRALRRSGMLPRSGHLTLHGSCSRRRASSAPPPFLSPPSRRSIKAAEERLFSFACRVRHLFPDYPEAQTTHQKGGPS